MNIGFRFTRIFEKLAITFLGWIPLFPGRSIRRLAYRSFVKRLGAFTLIETGVVFVNASQIEIGRQVIMDQYVRVRCLGRKGKIIIGDQVVLARGVDIKTHSVDGAMIQIGERSNLSPHCSLSGKFIKIGRNCLIAHYVGIFANDHVFADSTLPIREQGHTYRGIIIEDDCWLGTGVKVLDGVTIGKGSVVGAGAVVTKSLPPYSIAVGMPAKIIGTRETKANKMMNISS